MPTETLTAVDHRDEEHRKRVATSLRAQHPVDRLFHNAHSRVSFIKNTGKDSVSIISAVKLQKSLENKNPICQNSGLNQPLLEQRKKTLKKSNERRIQVLKERTDRRVQELNKNLDELETILWRGSDTALPVSWSDYPSLLGTHAINNPDGDDSASSWSASGSYYYDIWTVCLVLIHLHTVRTCLL